MGSRPLKRKDLISGRMLEQNTLMHKRSFGGSSWRYAEVIADWAKNLDAHSVLDYGAGECTLKSPFMAIRPQTERYREYDPAIEHISALPEPADLVVCTDVLEHVEPATLDNVITHLCDLSVKGAFLLVATRPANKILPNGDNAHAIIEPGEWWLDRVSKFPWRITHTQIKPRKDGKGDKEIRFWIRKD